jgi:hypothetical protein
MEGKLWKDAVVITAICHLIVMSYVYIVTGGARCFISSDNPRVMVRKQPCRTGGFKNPLLPDDKMLQPN